MDLLNCNLTHPTLCAILLEMIILPPGRELSAMRRIVRPKKIRKAGAFFVPKKENPIMEWIMLLLAGIFEVAWAILMKWSDGFTVPLPTVGTIVGYVLSAIFLSIALKKLPLGTAYAMWTGFGILGTTIFGILFFQESINAAKIVCIALIVCGIAGLKLLCS